MSIVSLEKYLNGPAAPVPMLASQTADESYVELADRLMAGICRSVLVGETFSDLCQDLEELRKRLQVHSSQTSMSEQARESEAVLQKFQERLRLDRQQTIGDFKRVLDLVSETFVHINATSERATDRFKVVEQGLNRASRIEDVTALRQHMTKMLESVRKDNKSEEQHREQLIENLGRKIRSVHEKSSALVNQLHGRTEALGCLETHCSQSVTSMHAALFALDTLGAIRTRHGDEVADRVLAGVAAGEIQSAVPTGHVFKWGTSSLLLLWQNDDANGSASDLVQHLRKPIEHRAFVGSRTAVFNLQVRSLVTPVQGTGAEMTEILDAFTRGSRV